MPLGTVYQAVWGRMFATVYDRAFAQAERSGFAAVRAEVTSRAGGRVLEVGAGTGLNLAHYPARVEELILAEPDRHMAGRLRRRAGGADQAPGGRAGAVTVVEAPAERLPVGDASVDTVVCTLVLCTTPDPERALDEMARVLKPGGVLSFAEHVRADDPGLARWQDRLNRPWGWYGCGCNCNRDTVARIRSSPLRLHEWRRDQLRGISPLVRPLAVGVAIKDA